MVYEQAQQAEARIESITDWRTEGRFQSRRDSQIYDKIKKTLKHAFTFGIGSVASSAYGVLLLPIYLRKIRTSEVGLLGLVTPALTILTIVLQMGLNHAFFRHYYETDDPEHRKRIVGSTLLFLLAVTVLAMLILLPLAPQISSIVLRGDDGRDLLKAAGENHAELMRLVFLTCFFEVITTVPASILRVNFRSARFSALSIVSLLVQFGAITYMVFFVEPSAKSVLTGRLLGTAFEALIFFWAVRRELSLKFSATELRGMLGFGAPLIFGQLAFILFTAIDRFFVERYGGFKEVGAYTIANSIVSVISILITVPFSQVWTVMRFSVMNEEGADEYYARVLTYMVIAGMFLALCVSAVAGDGIIRFGLQKYWPAAVVIPLLALSTVLDGASRVLNVGITLRKRTILSPVVIGAALAVNLGLNILLIPRYGMLGATVATLLSYIAFCGFRYWASSLFYKVRYEWGRVSSALAVGSAIITLFYIIDYFKGAGTLRMGFYITLLIKVLLALSFPGFLYLLNFYDEKERRKLSELSRELWGRIKQSNATEPAVNSFPLLARSEALSELPADPKPLAQLSSTAAAPASRSLEND